MSPFEFLIAPPYPTGPRLPLAASSTLSFKDPARGADQEFGLEIGTGIDQEIELLGGNSLIPKS